MPWEVQITGDDSDLRLLSNALAGGEVEIAESPSGYVLRANEFESLDSADSVRERAVEIAASLSGSIRLLAGGHRSITVGAVHRVRPDGKRDITLVVEPVVARARVMPVGIKVTRRDGTVEVHQPAEQVSRWLPLAKTSPAVARALRLRGAGDLSWVDLYRLFEVMEGDLGPGIYQIGSVTKNEVELFTRTANSLAAAGDQARHGKERTVPPAKPMPLSRARELVDRLLRSWLDFKERNTGTSAT